jgi:hypothetical protein
MKNDGKPVRAGQTAYQAGAVVTAVTTARGLREKCAANATA